MLAQATESLLVQKLSMFIKHLFSFVLFHLIKMFQLGTR